jgi:hypothetical protein
MVDVAATIKSRLFHIFKQMPTVIELVDILADPLQDSFDMCDYILDNTAIDDAEGHQLKLRGELIGVRKPLAQEDSDNIFTMCRLGETGDLDGSTGFYDDSDPDVPIGGYMVSEHGLTSRTDPDAEVTDAYFRILIRQKGMTFRQKMTHENLYNYLIYFGARCLLNEDVVLEVEMEPLDYHSLNEWEKGYIVKKGFKPAGVLVTFSGNLTHGAAI